MFKQIAEWKGLRIYAWHIGDEHLHLHIAYIIQILKGKTSGWIKKKTKKFPSGVLWGRGYYVSTVGIDEMAVRKYVENQQHYQVSLEQLNLFKDTDVSR